MDHDLMLALGVVLLALSLPSFLAAWVEARLSRSGVIMITLATGLIGWAVHFRPKTLTLEQIPDVLLGVFARMFN